MVWKSVVCWSLDSAQQQACSLWLLRLQTVLCWEPQQLLRCGPSVDDSHVRIVVPGWHVMLLDYVWLVWLVSSQKGALSPVLMCVFVFC